MLNIFYKEWIRDTHNDSFNKLHSVHGPYFPQGCWEEHYI